MENVAPCCTWKHHFLSQRSLVKHGVSRSSITLSNRTHAKIATQTTPPDSLPSIHLQFLDPCRSVLPWILSLWLQTTQQTYRMWRGTQESGRREGGRVRGVGRRLTSSRDPAVIRLRMGRMYGEQDCQTSGQKHLKGQG